MSRIKIEGPLSPFDATVAIGGSKSISNRVLLIKALCNNNFNITHLSDSDDTKTMLNLADSERSSYDVHHAGTCFRFLTAKLAISNGTQLLTGSSRMLQRPIGPLVDALKSIGADIKYSNKQGYPPIILGAFLGQKNSTVLVNASVSSQFVSALCMIAPVLPYGLTIILEGTIVSRSYLEMTLNIMKDFGIQSSFVGNKIIISPQKYIGHDYTVESDWSSASYHYALVSLLNKSKLRLSNYFKKSPQGDSLITDLYKLFGVETTYHDKYIQLSSTSKQVRIIKYNFINQPDLVQTFAAMAAGLGVEIQYQGVQTLALKESDRMEALSTELSKVAVTIRKNKKRHTYTQRGKAIINEPIFDTYQDHRMAMALAPLSILGAIYINDPEVVTKSYPDYWDDLVRLGFKITYV